jgi:SAM-dependent methyltransferase
MAKARNYFAWQARLVMPELGARVLEAGCGTGNFSRWLVDRTAVMGIDSDEVCISRWRERYAGRTNLEARVCDLDSPEFQELSRFRADSCVCLNVLEHVERDEQALRAMASVLQPAGTIVLLVPAFPTLAGPIDARLGHHRRYTRRSLTRVAEAAGLRAEKLRYVNFVGFFGWWANSHIFRRQAQSELQITIFDRAIVPWLSRLEHWIAPPFGQSLFAVLRKP